jgi:hypothetical protein
MQAYDAIAPFLSLQSGRVQTFTPGSVFLHLNNARTRSAGTFKMD